MYSLTIHFGPNAMVWSFLFKDKEKAKLAFKSVDIAICEQQFFRVEDDFGQTAIFGQGDAKGCLLEDLALVQEARILRSLDNARGEIKAKQRAMSDPVIRTGVQGPGVISPNFGRQ